MPETVNVRHILIKTPLPGPDGKVDPKGVEAARARALDVLKQLKAGAKFEEMAKKYSEDPGSKDKGGDLDWALWVSRSAEFPRFLLAATAPSQQDLVNLPNEPVAQGKPLLQPSDAVFQGAHVIRDFNDVIYRHARQLVQLEQQQVR